MLAVGFIGGGFGCFGGVVYCLACLFSLFGFALWVLVSYDCVDVSCGWLGLL